MDNTHRSTGESWKEVASTQKSSNSKAGPTVQQMIARMDELWPFKSARGVFDNGCGTGSIISHVLEAHGASIPEETRILAGDFSEPMLEVLRERKENATQSGNEGRYWNRLEICNLDAQNLAVPDDSLSHVTGGHVYFLLPNPHQALRETNRVLCPDGVIALTSGKTSQHIDALRGGVEAVRPGTNLKLFKEPWASEEGVKGELEATGFVEVETHLHETELKYDSHESFAAMLLKMPVMKDATMGYSDDERQLLQEQVVERLRQANPAPQGVLTGVGITAFGRKRG